MTNPSSVHSLESSTSSGRLTVCPSLTLMKYLQIVANVLFLRRALNLQEGNCASLTVVVPETDFFQLGV